jgi:SAM-dependent methyltransferase
LLIPASPLIRTVEEIAMSTEVNPDAFNAFEAASWGARATSYHRAFVPLTSQVIGPLLDAAEVGQGLQVLDVCTGPGYVAAAAAARGATAVGLDVAEEMVALASSLQPHVTFIQGDAEQLRFADGAFEAVVANFGIPHFGRPERAAAEFARVTAPGRKIALSTWDVPSASRLPGIFYEAAQEVGAAPPPDLPAGPSFYRFADDDEFIRLLTDAGLTEVGVTTVGFTYHFTGDLFDCLLDGTVRARALVAGQPEATQAKIRAVFHRVSAEYAADGGLDLPISVKVASGRRP